MAFFLKYFKQRADYEAYMNSGNVLLPNVSMCADDESWTIYYNPQGIIVPNNEIWYTSTDEQAHPIVLEIIRKIVDKQYTEQELVVVLENMGVPSSYIPMVVNMFLNNDQTEASVIELLGGLAGIDAEEAIYLEDLAKNFVENIYDENGGILKFKDDYEIIDIHTNSYLNYFFDAETLESVNVPNSVTSIGSHVFDWCTILTSVTIGNGVTSIGDRTFSGCSSLTSITIPNSVISIGERAFSGCSSLASITIPNSVMSIGNYAFYECWNLTSVAIPNGVTSIGEYAFYYCEKLTSVTIPNSVTIIGNYAFKGCGLTTVTIPNSVTSIGEYAFQNCSNLTSITIGRGLLNIGNYAFYGTAISSVNITDIETWCRISNLSALMQGYNPKRLYINNEEITNLVIPDSVISIPEYAFYFCSSLTSITIGNSVESIGADAFYGCRGLTAVTIPNSVTSIGDMSFYYCDGLTSITIPNSVTSIGYQAFQECCVLTTMNIEAVTPPTLGIYAIPSVTTTIYVPSESVNAYKTATNWSSYASKIQAIP